MYEPRVVEPAVYISRLVTCQQPHPCRQFLNVAASLKFKRYRLFDCLGAEYTNAQTMLESRGEVGSGAIWVAGVCPVCPCGSRCLGELTSALNHVLGLPFSSISFDDESGRGEEGVCGAAGQSLWGYQLETRGSWLLLVGGSIAAPKWPCDTFLGRRPWCGRCSRLLCLWTGLGVCSTGPGSQ